MLQVRNLSKNFASVQAVSDVSFSIQAGEVVGLLGPNGAGKTTTMRMLTGYYQPSSGNLSFDGKTLFAADSDNKNFEDNMREAQKQIGYLPESFSGYAYMNVQEFLAFVGQSRGLSGQAFRDGLDYAVSSVSLEKYFYRPIPQLSKGYKQRLGLAATLLHKPNLLILDEPTSGLDPNQIVEIQNLILSLAKEKTVILSTHILKEVESVCSRALIISNGKLVLDKPLAQIRQMSLAKRLYRFLLRSPENKNSQELTQLLTTELQQDIQVQAQNGCYAVSLQHSADATSADDFSFAEKIFNTCVRHNLILLELSQEKQGLEEVFRHITLSQN